MTTIHASPALCFKQVAGRDCYRLEPVLLVGQQYVLALALHAQETSAVLLRVEVHFPVRQRRQISMSADRRIKSRIACRVQHQLHLRHLHRQHRQRRQRRQS